MTQDKPNITYGGCVDCDDCLHRSEDCLCDISEDEEGCPLLSKNPNKSVYGKKFVPSLGQYLGFCTKCDMALNSLDNFCNNCGSKIDWDEDVI